MKKEPKTYEDRLHQLLDAGQNLFFQHGYEKTSVRKIIDFVDIAKGTFYHYFKSKEELLEKLIIRESQRIIKPLMKDLDNPDINALDKMNILFKKSGMKKVQNKKLMLMLTRTLFKDSNIKLRHHMTKIVHKMMLPEFEKIIAQGIEEDIFHTISAHDAAELLFNISLGLNESLAPLFLELDKHPEYIDKIEAKLHTYEYAVERILGAEEGSIHIFNREVFEIFMSNEEERQS